MIIILFFTDRSLVSIHFTNNERTVLCMGLFKKKYDDVASRITKAEKEQVFREIPTCKWCRCFDPSREMSLSRTSGVTYTNASQPKCSSWTRRK